MYIRRNSKPSLKSLHISSESPVKYLLDNKTVKSVSLPCTFINVGLPLSELAERSNAIRKYVNVDMRQKTAVSFVLV